MSHTASPPSAALLSLRRFLGCLAAIGAAAAVGADKPAAVPRRGIKPGFDNFAIRDREFWRFYPEARAADLAAFLALAAKGRPLEPFRPDPRQPREACIREYQQAELANSIAYCRTRLDLGLRGRTS